MHRAKDKAAQAEGAEGEHFEQWVLKKTEEQGQWVSGDQYKKGKKKS